MIKIDGEAVSIAAELALASVGGALLVLDRSRRGTPEARRAAYRRAAGNLERAIATLTEARDLCRERSTP